MQKSWKREPSDFKETFSEWVRRAIKKIKYELFQTSTRQMQTKLEVNQKVPNVRLLV